MKLKLTISYNQQQNLLQKYSPKEMTEKETLIEQDLEKSDSSIHDLEGIC